MTSRPFALSCTCIQVNVKVLVLALVLLGASVPADAELDDEVPRSLTLQCSYRDHETFESESALINRTLAQTGEKASTKMFKRGGEPKQAIYVVEPGEFAECVFPSGNSVRLKVGEGKARPFGACGGDPEVFASIWMNQRKIATRVWFTGHCREQSYYPEVSFGLSNIGSWSAQKCHSEKTDTSEATDNPLSLKWPDSLSVCIDFPDIQQFPIDELEYPLKTKTLRDVGEVELLAGSHKVCRAALEELTADFHTFSGYANRETIKLSRPNWIDPSPGVPEELTRFRESTFDFNNDGKRDRVFIRYFQTSYLDGSVMLVQPGMADSELYEHHLLMNERSWFIPCQIGSAHTNFRACPVFSQEPDETGFSVKGKKSGQSVYFRARYVDVEPFSFDGDSFVGISSNSEDTENFVAVLKPLSNRTFEPTCLFSRIEENF